MHTTDRIVGRRSIRKFKNDRISHSLLESIISSASFSPSWKNAQITRYIAVKDTSIIQKIAADFTVSCIKKTADDKSHWYGVKFEIALPELMDSLNIPSKNI